MSLSVIKRHEKIMELLLQDGEVKSAGLSQLMGVTGKTIREDLEKLEEQGLLSRVHGGAVPKNDGHVGSFPGRAAMTNCLQQKGELAAKALERIEPRDIIALDGGSTTLEMARRLPNAPLTVITNDLFIISELVHKDQIHLVVPGGYQKRNLLVNGESLSFLKKLNVQKVFISTTGLHLDYGLTIYTSDLAEQKQALIECAKYRYCVADHSKFDKYALMTFAQLSEMDAIITDSGLDAAMRNRYQGAGVPIQ
ncbi:DeoR/GlpR family DNA-binding transcription regulator [Paenibacillus sp. N1-5-1-14]|uniref:DeoR/GlpR family DNA-binding transcription regulator n=1 Tax=Paenibacillus radicibacter TaxID=2972488 RepID=UPI0021595244|nr:DeoR/GlpR family DNA-binding transcription regulator [Paenibacillus radicibacter]MCR8644811.1 DeoR/GlpR family DNA-binding transcription regulator [Paenibacillus radicibacter]